MTESAGFEAAKTGLQAVSAQTGWMNSQVSAGKLSLNPEVAEKAAQRVEEEIAALRDLIRRGDQLARVQGLGDYPDGTDLAKRFSDKAMDPSAGAVPLVRQLTEELQKQADAFRAAAKDYRATDEQNADDLRRGIQ